MNERDLQAEETLVRLDVDQLRTRAPQILERRTDVGDLECDVVHARTALREEAADGRVVAARRDELEPARTDEHGRRLDTLVRHLRAVLDGAAEEPRIRVDRVVEIADGDAEMMDAARVHAADASG